jgi:predicted dehydrogenase
MSRKVRVGVIGVGALGQHHARVIASLPEAQLVGVFDRDQARAAEVSGRHGARAFPDVDALLAETEAVVVAVPTVDHCAVGLHALSSGNDVLLEKPVAVSLAEADRLIAEAAARGRLLQVGHVERFNPATDTLRQFAPAPRFIEVHRLGAFSARSLDIDVVLDLMVHDLDIVLSLDGSELVQVDAVGVPVLTPKVDIANARVRFASGLIANLTASRVSAERIRKFRVFSPRAYISADFVAREAQVYRLLPGADGRPEIRGERLGSPEDEPLRRQFVAFLRAVSERSRPEVPGEDGRKVLALALRIQGEIARGLLAGAGVDPRP